MILVTRGLASIYEIESLCRMLFPDIRRADSLPTDSFVLAAIEAEGEKRILTATLSIDAKTESQQQILYCTEAEAILPLALLIYRLYESLCARSLRWGVLTGIRPIKLYHSLFEQGLSDAAILERMQQQWAVSPAMSRLALQIAKTERGINALCVPQGFSLYISIPFCPARCSYCSFVSQSVERDRALLPAYTEALVREIRLLGETARQFQLFPQTIYIGGGTPTVLDNQQLDCILETVAQSFDLSQLLEYTVEAGRPDTITRDNLRLLQQGGVNRISINPQTMEDAVLETVGRHHTAADVEASFHLARELGFDNINMDLIAGLPGDDLAGFRRSVTRLLQLRPENITVHSLTLKRGTRLTQQQGAQETLHQAQDLIAAMVDFSRESICLAGYAPYYLYRQKGSVGNLDNTGYALPDRACIYNVVMMDETQTILCAGAGAVTKLCPPTGKIDRLYAHKLPLEFIKDYDRMNHHQQKVREFFETGHTK